jgi:hypothetical protein
MSGAAIAAVVCCVLVALKGLFYYFYCVRTIHEGGEAKETAKELQQKHDKLVENYPILLVSVSGDTATVSGVSNTEDIIATVVNLHTFHSATSDRRLLTTSAARRICASAAQEVNHEFKLVCAETGTVIGSHPLPSGYMAIDRAEEASSKPASGVWVGCIRWYNCYSRGTAMQDGEPCSAGISTQLIPQSRPSNDPAVTSVA